jgi:hypothetical protein
MIVTMAYDEDLAGGQRRGWPDDPLLQGGDEALLAKPGARPFEMRGLEMKGWLRVDAESVSPLPPKKK